MLHNVRHNIHTYPKYGCIRYGHGTTVIYSEDYFVSYRYMKCFSMKQSILFATANLKIREDFEIFF